jgi:Flp pilus assembly protein TadG
MVTKRFAQPHPAIVPEAERMIESSKPKRFSKIRETLARLRRDQSGLALVEFAYSLPIFIGLGMYGTETAHRSVATMQVSQAALALADNAGRLGQTGNGNLAPTIQESAVLETLAGTRLQTENLDLLANGRVILSSLEVRTVTDSNGTRQQQFIRWQRCKGTRAFTSAYVNGINTSNAAFTGVGESGNVRAVTNSAVMFVEIQYAYQPLFGDMFAGGVIVNQDAAFTIRDDRNLTAGLNNDLNPTSLAATCDKFDAT